MLGASLSPPFSGLSVLRCSFVVEERRGMAAGLQVKRAVRDDRGTILTERGWIRSCQNGFSLRRGKHRQKSAIPVTGRRVRRAVHDRAAPRARSAARKRPVKFARLGRRGAMRRCRRNRRQNSRARVPDQCSPVENGCGRMPRYSQIFAVLVTSCSRGVGKSGCRYLLPLSGSWPVRNRSGSSRRRAWRLISLGLRHRDTLMAGRPFTRCPGGLQSYISRLSHEVSVFFYGLSIERVTELSPRQKTSLRRPFTLAVLGELH